MTGFPNIEETNSANGDCSDCRCGFQAEQSKKFKKTHLDPEGFSQAWSLPEFNQNVIEEGVFCAFMQEKVSDRKIHNRVSKLSVVEQKR